MKKLLIVCGDSYCDTSFRSGAHPEMDVSWPKWPELLAEKWDMDIINLSNSGSGNEYIYSRLQNEILSMEDKSRIGMVIPAWTQINRLDYQISRGHIAWKDTNNRYSWHSKRINGNGDLQFWARKSLRLIMSFQILCERHDIPYMQFGMLHPYRQFLEGLQPTENEVFAGAPEGECTPFPFGDPEKSNSNVLRIYKEYDKLIDKEKFPGWPLTKELGGYTLEYKLLGWGTTNEKDWVISNIDAHPNAKGQERLMEWIKKQVEVVYDRLG
jgi:hypothetical protein